MIKFVLLRCALPWLSNDSYASQGPWHDAMVRASIPWREDRYDGCRISRSPGSLSNGTVQCDKWVYSEEDFQSTLVTDVRTRMIHPICKGLDMFKLCLFVCLFGFLTSSSTTRLNWGWPQDRASDNFTCCHT